MTCRVLSMLGLRHETSADEPDNAAFTLLGLDPGPFTRPATIGTDLEPAPRRFTA